MADPQKQLPDSPAGVAYQTLGGIFYSSGRRGVRIYGLPPEQMVIATVLGLLLGLPLIFIVAIAPFWDHVGDLTAVQALNAYIAPAVNSLPRDYLVEFMPRFPLKRFFVATASLVELIVLANLAVLVSRRVRKHALLVWICYDRAMVLGYFALGGAIFFGLWFLLYADWRILSFFHSDYLIRLAVKIDICAVLAMPFAAAFFGHMGTIVGLGAIRDVRRSLRRFRKAASGISPPSVA